MVRLTKKEIEAIKSSVYRYDPSAKIYLFGSRVDSKKRGGDIDLLVFSRTLKDRHKIDIKHEIFKSLEEQKMDIVICTDASDPFVKIALLEGVEL